MNEMKIKMNKDQYTKLIEQDILAVKLQPESLERDHTIGVLKASIDLFYPSLPDTGKTGRVEEAAERYLKSITLFHDSTDCKNAFIAGYNYAQQPEPSTALDETRDSLSELIRSLSQIVNTINDYNIPEYHKTRLAKAKEVLAKYADPNQPRIVQSQQEADLRITEGRSKQELTETIELNINDFCVNMNDVERAFGAGILASGISMENLAKLNLTEMFEVFKRQFMDCKGYDPVKPEPMGGKSLQECKDEVAKQMEYKSWEELREIAKKDELDCFWEEAAELYAQQSQPLWNKVSDNGMRDKEYYIVYSIKEGMEIAQYSSTLWRGSSGNYLNPTHYMEKPSLPLR